jgi:hypothetical protein
MERLGCRAFCGTGAEMLLNLCVYALATAGKRRLPKNRCASLVLEIPPQRLEKRREEVRARLRLKIVLRRIVLLVGFKLADELLEIRVKGGDGHGQGWLLVLT